jgi:glycosyltransferase involved in cell wall biosynthesis
VYAGNPDAYQDIHVLLEAMPHVDARLLVVSAADWGVRLPSRAVQVRPQGWRDARDWIAGADVAALPRSVCAGYPIKLLNYAALGLPTVIAAGSAQGVTGERVVPNRDTRAFARGLEEALAARDRVDGEAFIAQNAWSARAAELDELYRSLEGG